MNRKAAFFPLFILALFAGCGGDPTTGPVTSPPPQAGAAAVSVSIKDMPPSGVTVLSFEVTITGMVLQPGNVSMISSPVHVEMMRLETLTAFLNTVQVPAGNYTQMQVTFANPRMTFLNNSGMPMMMGGCQAGSVCEITPGMMSSSVTMSGSPFPLSVQANSPMGLLLDFDMLNSIMGDMSVNPTVSCARRTPMQGTGQLEEIEDMLGLVTAKDATNNQFTLQVMHGAQSLTVKVDGSTQYDDFDDAGLANGFPSLAVGQTVEVDLRLVAGGILLATKVEFEDTDNEEELEGMVIRVASATQFEMVLMHEAADVAGIQAGNLLRVNLLPGTSFRIDDEGLPISGLLFASAVDMMVGQAVQIERKALRTGTPTEMDTDRVELKETSFTARVKAKLNSTDFTVENLPGMFTGTTQIEVRTSASTRFEDISGVPALNVGDTVSIRGLLFKTAGDPVMAAGRVRKR